MKKVLWGGLLASTVCLYFAFADLIVETKSGPVRGTHTWSKDVGAFLGIPFAEPPVGKLRFAKPIAKPSWTEIYNATQVSSPCAQFTKGAIYYMPDSSSMSEDCLYLNLWVPNSESTPGPRPVVIFIHGGLFVFGSSSYDIYDGTKLASRSDLVVASFNYRVGAMGFFIGRTEDAPGNVGMYDQILAIKWIKNNAPAFGGDPDNIILMGESAGAFSISAHMVSPLTRGLFKSAILQSGSAIQPFTFDENLRLHRNSYALSSYLGCANESTNLENEPASVVECLRMKSQEEIVEFETMLLKSHPITFFPRANDEFLPKSVIDLYRAGNFSSDINVLLGVNHDEGSLISTFYYPEYFGLHGDNGHKFNTKSMAVAVLRSAIQTMNVRNASELIGFYIKQVKAGAPLVYLKMISDFMGDFALSCGTTFLADLLSLKGNKVYFYKFGFRAANTPLSEWMGVTHFDEIQYIFGNPFHGNFTVDEIQMSYLMMDRWSEFAKTGDPNIPHHLPWLPYSYHNKIYLNIGQEEESIRLNPKSSCEIWRTRFKSDVDGELMQRLRNCSTSEKLR